MAPENAAKLLTVYASDLTPFDSLDEGRVVISIRVYEREVFSMLSGPERVRCVDVTSVPARTAIFETLPDGTHLHDIDRSDSTVRTMLVEDRVRVVRPGPIEPCACGFGR